MEHRSGKLQFSELLGDDSDSAGAAQAISACCDHCLSVSLIVDTASSLHLASVADSLLHQGYVVNSCAAGAKASTCLNERGSGSHAILASTNDLLVIKEAALQDYLYWHGTRGLYNSLDISDNVVVVARDQVTAVDDHVNLGGAVGNALLGLGNLSCS